MASFFYTTTHPDMYHGHEARPPFFEGWYFKLVSPDGAHKYAIIPGVILGEHGHAFIQVLDGTSGQSAYFDFPQQAFQASQTGFEVSIQGNHFDGRSLRLDLSRHPKAQPGQVGHGLGLRGEVRFGELARWPVSLAAPGVMGPFAWVPFMECYHGVVSLDHRLEGELEVNRRSVSGPETGPDTDAGAQQLVFSGGRGYIEKDWGRSFPEAWIWFQSNHFSPGDGLAAPGAPVCLTGSIAIIPWLGTSFNGFIIGLWRAGRLYRFATYTGARVEKLSVSENQVDWVVSDRRHRLEIQARREGSGLLLGPTTLEMGKRILESLTAQVTVRLSTCSGQTLFEGQGRHAGLEVYEPGKLSS